MTNEEKKELAALKAKCLHSGGKPRKDAATADLKRLSTLRQKELSEAPVDIGGFQRLTADERDEMKEIEQKAKTAHGPTPVDPILMRRLGELRQRANIK